MSPQIWNAQLNVRFLAWLDFTIERQLDFNSTIIDHLRAHTDKEFTLSQIRSRFDSLVREERSKRSPAILSTDIRVQGSSCLETLDSGTRTEIEAALSQYRAFYPSAQHSKEAGESPKQATPRKRTIPHTNQNKKMPQQVVKNQEPIDRRKTQQPVGFQGVRAINLDKPQNVQMADNGKSSAIQSQYDHSKVPATSAIAELGAEILRLEAQNRAIRAEWQEEVEDLDNQIAKRKCNEHVLKAEILSLKEARRERERAGTSDLEEELFVKIHDTWLWQKQVKDMRALKGFTDDNFPKPKPIGAETVQRALHSIGTGLQAILHGYDAATVSQAPIVRSGSDLDILLHSMFEEATEISHVGRMLISQTLKWGLHAVIRGLATTAIKEWVFASDFPNFAGKGTPRILQEYQTIISSFGGWTRLHNLDVAAHHSLIEGDNFVDTVLPRKAESLADQLSMALAPLFVQSADTLVDGKFASWGQDDNTCKTRRECFKQIFETALKLKVATVLTDEQYEFVLCPIGKLYQGSDTNRNDQSTNARGPNNEQKDWMHASLLIYTSQSSLPRDKVQSALVQPRNFFLTKERGDRQPFHTQNLTTRAVSAVNTYSHREITETISDQPQTANERVPARPKVPHTNVQAIPSDSASRILPPAPIRPPKRKQSMNLGTSGASTSTERPSKRQAQNIGGSEMAVDRTSPKPGRHTRYDGGKDSDGDYQEGEDSDPDVEGVKSMLATGKRFQCRNCDKRFRAKRKLKAHEDKGKCQACDYCGQRFKDLRSVRIHQSNKPCRADPEDAGTVEESASEEVSTVEGHDKSTTRQKVACDWCGNWYANKSSMKQHQKNNHCKGRQCPECDETFWGPPSDLELHIGTAHCGPVSSLPLSSSPAEAVETAVAEDGNDGDNRIAEETADRPKCPDCGPDFERAQFLQTHIANSNGTNLSASKEDTAPASSSAKSREAEGAVSDLIDKFETARVSIANSVDSSQDLDQLPQSTPRVASSENPEDEDLDIDEVNLVSNGQLPTEQGQHSRHVNSLTADHLVDESSNKQISRQPSRLSRTRSESFRRSPSGVDDRLHSDKASGSQPNLPESSHWHGPKENRRDMDSGNDPNSGTSFLLTNRAWPNPQELVGHFMQDKETDFAPHNSFSTPDPVDEMREREIRVEQFQRHSPSADQPSSWSWNTYDTHSDLINNPGRSSSQAHTSLYGSSGVPSGPNMFRNSTYFTPQPRSNHGLRYSSFSDSLNGDHGLHLEIPGNERGDLSVPNHHTGFATNNTDAQDHYTTPTPPVPPPLGPSTPPPNGFQQLLMAARLESPDMQNWHGNANGNEDQETINQTHFLFSPQSQPEQSHLHPTPSLSSPTHNSQGGCEGEGIETEPLGAQASAARLETTQAPLEQARMNFSSVIPTFVDKYVPRAWR
ncbi:uncharacterized protein PAC_14947 [Phialocephala subalpina]|uniref:C2H2-type domain-containing protein n=1 Tax=Phialocephala subalpina TaxID=576137 RepID=A0A1L7XJA3_9HELO|nr:uncharacterized protein PAC_14947 [Phialocephala subalpina]